MYIINLQSHKCASINYLAKMSGLFIHSPHIVYCKTIRSYQENLPTNFKPWWQTVWSVGWRRVSPGGRASPWPQAVESSPPSYISIAHPCFVSGYLVRSEVTSSGWGLSDSIHYENSVVHSIVTIMSLKSQTLSLRWHYR